MFGDLLWLMLFVMFGYVCDPFPKVPLSWLHLYHSTPSYNVLLDLHLAIFGLSRWTSQLRKLIWWLRCNIVSQGLLEIVEGEMKLSIEPKMAKRTPRAQKLGMSGLLPLELIQDTTFPYIVRPFPKFDELVQSSFHINFENVFPTSEDKDSSNSTQLVCEAFVIMDMRNSLIPLVPNGYYINNFSTTCGLVPPHNLHSKIFWMSSRL